MRDLGLFRAASVLAGVALAAMGGIDASRADGALVAQWTFNEDSGNALDSSGNGAAADATVMGSAVRQTSGASRWLELDGVDDYAITGADVAKLNLTNSLTLVAWVRVDAAMDDNEPAIGRNNGFFTGTWGFTFYPHTGGAYPTEIYAYTNGGGAADHLAINNELGEFRKYVMTYTASSDPNENNLILYIYNGATLVGSAQMHKGAIDDVPNDRPFVVGASTSRNSYLKGAVDEVRVYDTALSPTEIANLVTTAVPEPAALTGLALAGLMFHRRKSSR